MTSDDIERPKRHFCRNKQNFLSLNSFRIKIRAKYKVAVSVNKIRVNSFYMGGSRSHLCDSKAFLFVSVDAEIDDKLTRY